MLKRILCLFACLVILVGTCTLPAFAATTDGEHKYIDLYTHYYDKDGNATTTFKYAEVYIPSGAHTLVYDDLFDSSGRIVYRNNIAFDSKNTLSATYGYIIGLINSSTVSSHAIINVEAEVNNLNYFMQQKWDDPTNNYEYRTYLEAAQVLGVFCMYSYDICGLNPITDDARDPDTEIIFYEWFNAMNKKFINDWSNYYNDKYSDTNGTAFFAYTHQANTAYDFVVGERKAKPMGTINVLYRTAEYYSYNLHLDGGSYVGTNDNVIDFVLNTISSIRIDLWAAWMPGQLAGAIIAFFSMIVALLTVMMTIKLVRG